MRAYAPRYLCHRYVPIDSRRHNDALPILLFSIVLYLAPECALIDKHAHKSEPEYHSSGEKRECLFQAQIHWRKCSRRLRHAYAYSVNMKLPWSLMKISWVSNSRNCPLFFFTYLLILFFFSSQKLFPFSVLPLHVSALSLAYGMESMTRF